MAIITFKTKENNKSFDLQEITHTDHLQKIKTFCEFDQLMIDFNRKKYENNKTVLGYLKAIRVPALIDKKKITLLSLLDFFQKQFVAKAFPVDFSKYSEKAKLKLPYENIEILSKMNNFAHLIGVGGKRDDMTGQVICRAKPKEFLDGTLYQWILLNSHDGFEFDYEKLEVFPWIYQTLTTPTFILPQSAIRRESTNFDADLIFIKKIFYSDKYAFHIVGLKQEKNNTYAFNSQFGITKQRFYRLNKMFDTKEALYDFFNEGR